MKIPNEIIELSKIFKENKKKLFIVGGYCRDILMNKSPLDIDLATDSLPDDTIKFLSPFYNIDLVGKAFGVIIVHLGKLKIEIASFRKDLEDDTGGRHHKVELGVSIEDDVLRRDITISSIFYDIENKKMVDIAGGKNDIKNKVIRMVGDPNIRLKEDPLRALRVLRFACRYSFSIDLDTKKALTKISLSNISQELNYFMSEACNGRHKNNIRYLNILESRMINPGIEQDLKNFQQEVIDLFPFVNKIKKHPTYTHQFYRIYLRKILASIRLLLLDIHELNQANISE